MEVKPGYKLTEVGVIPEEWEVKPFREIGKLSKGKGLLKEQINHSGAIPAIPYTALYTDFSEVLDYRLIKWFIDDGTQSVIVCEPCLLLASSSNMEANTGKASALVGTTPVAVGREVIIFKTWADCTFISYLLSTPFYRKTTLTLARGTTIKHVYPATFQDYQVAQPALDEQRAIATALSDVDALLDGLDRLIAKKRDLKQAAIQQLLTGQTRLPGFHGEWEVKRLGDLCTLKSGDAITAASIDDSSPFPCYGGNGLRGYTARFTHKGAYCLIGRVGALCGNLLRVDGRFFASEHAIVAAAFEDVDVGWLTLALGTLNLNRRAESSAQPVLTVSKLLPLEILAPSTKEEQTAIAAVLSDMDAELAALEARRDKTRDLKQAMMQELLTGKTRLVPPGGSHD